MGVKKKPTLKILFRQFAISLIVMLVAAIIVPSGLEGLAVNGESYDWVAQQFKDWAFTLTTSVLYYNDYDSIDEDTRNLYRKAMAAFGGIAPTYHIELLEKPTIYWDFHSLLLGIQMMFSFMLVDDAKPLRLCKHCQKVFLGSRANSAFCSARCKNQYNVYKSRGKNKGQDGENDD